MNSLATTRNMVARNKTARRTGRWPKWEVSNFPGGTGSGKGWLREVTYALHNGVFAVLCRDIETPIGTVTHAAFRDVTNSVDFTWAEKQRIKDECLGADRTAVEVFPAAADLVDDANMFHLWVLPVGYSLPFGLPKDAL